VIQPQVFEDAKPKGWSITYRFEYKCLFKRDNGDDCGFCLYCKDVESGAIDSVMAFPKGAIKTYQGEAYYDPIESKGNWFVSLLREIFGKVPAS